MDRRIKGSQYTQQPVIYTCPILQSSQILWPRARFSVFTKRDSNGHASSYVQSNHAVPFLCKGSLLVHKRKRSRLEEERWASVKERDFQQGSMVAIETAPFVCTYSEQLLLFGFWWQGHHGGNGEGKKQG